MKLIDKITIFSLLRARSLYLISNLFGEALIRGQRLKEGEGCLFQGKGNTSHQTKNLCFCPFQQ